MATTLSAKRLKKELLSIQRDPVENITAVPLESNILIWHYIIKGAKGSPYEGGYYHGMLKFPPEYPLKPPSIKMFTPNGRFKQNTRLCLSMSDFHPESWNPMWSVSTILTGLQAFMLDSAPTLGSIETSTGQKRKLAGQSMDYNLKNAVFVKLFPEAVEEYEEVRRQQQLDLQNSETKGEDSSGRDRQAEGDRNGARQGGAGDGNLKHKKPEEPGLVTLGICIAVTIAILAIILRLSA